MNHAQTLINELHDVYGLTDRELAEYLNCSREYIGAVRNERKAGNNLVPELIDIKNRIIRGSVQAPASVPGSANTSARTRETEPVTELEPNRVLSGSFGFIVFVLFLAGTVLYAWFSLRTNQEPGTIAPV